MLGTLSGTATFTIIHVFAMFTCHVLQCDGVCCDFDVMQCDVIMYDVMQCNFSSGRVIEGQMLSPSVTFCPVSCYII